MYEWGWAMNGGGGGEGELSQLPIVVYRFCMQCCVLDRTHLEENLPFLEWKALVDFALSVY